MATSDSEQGAGIGNAIATTLPLSKSEEEVLRHYDRLQELKLEIALLRAQQSYSAGIIGPYCPAQPCPAQLITWRNQTMYLSRGRRHTTPREHIEEPGGDPPGQVIVFT